MERGRPIGIGLALLGLMTLAAAASAQEPAAPGEPPEAAGEEAERANELAVFIGGTHEEEETHFTLGVEYERRLGERLGLAFVAEHVDGVDAWVFLAPLTIRPALHLGLKLYAGPGFETKDDETLFVFRTGLGWVIETGRVSFTPQVELDLAHEREEWQAALVFGIAIGFGF